MRLKKATDLKNISTHFFFNFLFKSFAFRGGVAFLFVFLFTPIFTSAQENVSKDNKAHDGISGFPSEGIYVSGGAIIIDASEKPTASNRLAQKKAEKKQIISNKKPAAKAQKPMIADAKKAEQEIKHKLPVANHKIIPAESNQSFSQFQNRKLLTVLPIRAYSKSIIQQFYSRLATADMSANFFLLALKYIIYRSSTYNTVFPVRPPPFTAQRLRKRIEYIFLLPSTYSRL